MTIPSIRQQNRGTYSLFDRVHGPFASRADAATALEARGGASFVRFLGPGAWDLVDEFETGYLTLAEARARCRELGDGSTGPAVTRWWTTDPYVEPQIVLWDFHGDDDDIPNLASTGSDWDGTLTSGAIAPQGALYEFDTEALSGVVDSGAVTTFLATSDVGTAVLVAGYMNHVGDILRVHSIAGGQQVGVAELFSLDPSTWRASATIRNDAHDDDWLVIGNTDVDHGDTDGAGPVVFGVRMKMTHNDLNQQEYTLTLWINGEIVASELMGIQEMFGNASDGLLRVSCLTDSPWVGRVGMWNIALTDERMTQLSQQALVGLTGPA